MDEITQPQQVTDGQRWADYMQIMRDNPVIEPSHQVNLGALASKYGVAIDAADLTAAIDTVNSDHDVQPPIQLLGRIVVDGGAHETYFTSAKGVHKFHIASALRSIAVQKMRANHTGNSAPNTL